MGADPRNGDEALRMHSGMARHIAALHSVTWYEEREDAVADALWALWQAGEEWDGTGSFRAFAWERIRWRVIDGNRQRNGRVGRKSGQRPLVFAPEVIAFYPPPVVDDASQLSYDFALEDLLQHCCRLDSERTFVKMRINGFTDLQIANELGVTESRVCQIRTKLLKRYRASLNLSGVGSLHG